MAATKTRKPAAKKTGAKKAAAPKVQTTGVGRTTPALKNRHRWSQSEFEDLATRVQKAGPSKQARDKVYAAVAKKLGNGITVQSVRAQYYAYMRKSGQMVGQPRNTAGAKGKATTRKVGAVQPLGKAPKYPTDPVQKVKAMVQRRGQVTRSVDAANVRLAQIAAQIADMQKEATSLSSVIENGNAELTSLNTALGPFAG